MKLFVQRMNFSTKMDLQRLIHQSASAPEGTSELLYLEAAAMAHGKVFSFGPTFRAEKSKHVDT